MIGAELTLSFNHHTSLHLYGIRTTDIITCIVSRYVTPLLREARREGVGRLEVQIRRFREVADEAVESLLEVLGRAAGPGVGQPHLHHDGPHSFGNL